MITYAMAQDGRYEAIKDLPQFQDGREFKIAWCNGYYDGPLSGIGWYQGRKHWFKCVDEGSMGKDQDGTPIKGRVFVVVKLTDEQIENATYTHNKFKEHVGSHTEYTYEDSGKRSRSWGQVNKTVDFDRYREETKHLPKDDYATNEVVGWYGYRPG